MIKKLITLAAVGAAAYGYFFYFPKQFIRENEAEIIAAAEKMPAFSFLSSYEVELGKPHLDTEQFSANRLTYRVPVIVKNALCPQFLMYVTVEPELDVSHFNFGWNTVSVSESARKEVES